MGPLVLGARVGRLQGGPAAVYRGVHRGADEHRERHHEDPQQYGHRRRQRAVHRGALDRADQVDPQSDAAEDQHHQGDQGAGDVLAPRGRDRHGQVVEGGQRHGQQRDRDRPVEGADQPGRPRYRVLQQPRPENQQRQHQRADHQRAEVEAERHQPGLDDAPLAVEPVHDGDGVDEDVEGPGAGPQGQQETDRDEVGPGAVEHPVQQRDHDLLDGGVRQHRPGGREDALLEPGDGALADELVQVAEGAGQPEQQRRDRQQGEEGRLRRQPGHPVLDAGVGGVLDQLPRRAGPDGPFGRAPGALAPAPGGPLGVRSARIACCLHRANGIGPGPAG